MKRFWTWGKISVILIFIFISIAGPFAINKAYTVGEENRENAYITIWGAEEVFGFWGEVVGAGATILALIYTIMYTEYQRINERKESCKPHLYSSWETWDNEEIMHKKWNNNFSIIIGKGIDIWGKSNYPPIIEIIRRIERLNYQEIPENVVERVQTESADTLIECQKNHIILEYYVKNVGVGTASDIKLLFGDKEILMPFALAVSEDYKILFDIDLTNLKQEEEWIIELQYNYFNIYGDDNFLQKEIIVACRNKEGAIYLMQDYNQKLSIPIKN